MDPAFRRRQLPKPPECHPVGRQHILAPRPAHPAPQCRHTVHRRPVCRHLIRQPAPIIRPRRPVALHPIIRPLVPAIHPQVPCTDQRPISIHNQRVIHPQQAVTRHLHPFIRPRRISSQVLRLQAAVVRIFIRQQVLIRQLLRITHQIRHLTHRPRPLIRPRALRTHPLRLVIRPLLPHIHHRHPHMPRRRLPIRRHHQITLRHRNIRRLRPHIPRQVSNIRPPRPNIHHPHRPMTVHRARRITLPGHRNTLQLLPNIRRRLRCIRPHHPNTLPPINTVPLAQVIQPRRLAILPTCRYIRPVAQNIRLHRPRIHQHVTFRQLLPCIRPQQRLMVIHLLVQHIRPAVLPTKKVRIKLDRLMVIAVVATMTTTILMWIVAEPNVFCRTHFLCPC